MKAVVYEGPGILQLQEVADVSPQPKEVMYMDIWALRDAGLRL